MHQCHDGLTDLIPMSLEQLKAFLEKVKGNPNLQEQLKAAVSPEDVVGVAKEYGYEFTVDKISQLSEGELEDVAGGHSCVDPSRPTCGADPRNPTM